jgi:hypothetical protein
VPAPREDDLIAGRLVSRAQGALDLRLPGASNVQLDRSPPMNKRLALTALTSLLACVAGAVCAAPLLAVTFVEPKNFTDAGYLHWVASEKDRAEVQHDIEQHLQGLAQRKLQPGQSLKIEVLDIDLAGRFEPLRFRAANEVRVMRESTWPRIKLRYTLSQGDAVTASREEVVSDLNYLGSINRYPSGDRLRYERAMLDHWFDDEIVKR